MAAAWLGIDSSHYNSHCGDEGSPDDIEGGLDGTGSWWHDYSHVHWCVLDLVESYTITKVRGRSDGDADPRLVKIYIDDNNPPTTLCKEFSGDWEETSNWVEVILATTGIGRYIKIEILSTKWGSATDMDFGDWSDPFKIFDAYGDIYAPPPAVLRPTASVGNPLIF